MSTAGLRSRILLRWLLVPRLSPGITRNRLRTALEGRRTHKGDGPGISCEAVGAGFTGRKRIRRIAARQANSFNPGWDRPGEKHRATPHQNGIPDAVKLRLNLTGPEASPDKLNSSAGKFTRSFPADAVSRWGVRRGVSDAICRWADIGGAVFAGEQCVGV